MEGSSEEPVAEVPDETTAVRGEAGAPAAATVAVGAAAEVAEAERETEVVVEAAVEAPAPAESKEPPTNNPELPTTESGELPATESELPAEQLSASAPPTVESGELPATEDQPLAEQPSAASDAGAAADEGGSAGPASAPSEADLKKLLMAQIFGDSDSDDDEDFAGFDEDEISAPPAIAKQKRPVGESKKAKKKKKRPADTDDGNAVVPENDFDAMMQRRRQEHKRRRKQDGDSTAFDDVAKAIVDDMIRAAEDDIQLNNERKPATNKYKMLPNVIGTFRKVHLLIPLVENRCLEAIRLWLWPLPDKSLPSLNIRSELISILDKLSIHKDDLMDSKIGQACMLLYQHPGESKQNKRLLKALIHKWARPVFDLDATYSKGGYERRMRDNEVLPERTRKRQRLEEEEKALRPGDKGFVMRARVPQDAMRDYVRRPRSHIDVDFSKKAKKSASMLDKLTRAHKDVKMSSRKGRQRAADINISGGYVQSK